MPTTLSELPDQTLLIACAAAPRAPAAGRRRAPTTRTTRSTRRPVDQREAPTISVPMHEDIAAPMATSKSARRTPEAPADLRPFA